MENVTLLLCVGCWRLVLIFGKKKWGLRGVVVGFLGAGGVVGDWLALRGARGKVAGGDVTRGRWGRGWEAVASWGFMGEIISDGPFFHHGGDNQ